jgi:hypothetical protein
MGRVAYENEDFYHAVRWMTVAMKTWEEEGEHSTAKIFDILDYLAYSTAQQGNINHAIQLTKRLLEMGLPLC